jgi:outer membrane murein-binding lipoprotein Lpp
MLIERGIVSKRSKADHRFLLIVLILVAALTIALFLQTMFSFKPRMQELSADQLELQQSIDQLGEDIDQLRQEVNGK